jgi:hypothetical protein
MVRIVSRDVPKDEKEVREAERRPRLIQEDERQERGQLVRAWQKVFDQRPLRTGRPRSFLESVLERRRASPGRIKLMKALLGLGSPKARRPKSEWPLTVRELDGREAPGIRSAFEFRASGQSRHALSRWLMQPCGRRLTAGGTSKAGKGGV